MTLAPHHCNQRGLPSQSGPGTQHYPSNQWLPSISPLCQTRGQETSQVLICGATCRNKEATRSFAFVTGGQTEQEGEKYHHWTSERKWANIQVEQFTGSGKVHTTISSHPSSHCSFHLEFFKACFYLLNTFASLHSSKEPREVHSPQCILTASL